MIALIGFVASIAMTIDVCVGLTKFIELK